MSKGIVTFTTDFGTEDHFVGTMKGVVLGINPEAAIFDICNQVPAFDILQGAITISQSYHYYPPGTIHVVVVDPGVGTSRRPIVADTGKHLFVAPDNGVLSLIFERENRITVRHVTAEHYFLQPVSTTFHGRDVFSAIAGHLSRGSDISRLGDPIVDYVRLDVSQPIMEDSRIIGSVLKIDRFGNIITNIDRRTLSQFISAHSGSVLIRMGSITVDRFQTSYEQGQPGEPFAILGSMGYVEIATNKGSAATLFRARPQDTVELTAIA